MLIQKLNEISLKEHGAKRDIAQYILDYKSAYHKMNENEFATNSFVVNRYVTMFVKSLGYNSIPANTFCKSNK